jgi:hypothetical protein
VIVKHEGKTYKLDKDSVYAVRYCSGAVERLFQGKVYPMVNPGEAILIYKVTIPAIGKTSLLKQNGISVKTRPGLSNRSR